MRLFLTALLTLTATSAIASEPIPVPEMDVAAGVAAIALLVGAAAIIREKFFRK